MSKERAYYVAPFGDDRWSGTLPEPNEGRTDGPFATVARAQAAMRNERRDRVLLRGGTYRLEEPLRFGPEDGGAPATYASFPGETAVLDGGRRLTGWRETTLDGLRVWVCDVPEAKSGAWRFRQLWVNGERRLRPRLPKRGLYRMAGVPGMTFDDELFQGSDSFEYAPGHIEGGWRNLQDVEVVVPHFWTDEHMPIASVDEANRIVRSSRRSIFVLKDDFVARNADYYVENVFEALSEPGEWYLDGPAGKAYYVPHPQETVDACDVVAPVAHQLLLLSGDPDAGDLVEGLTFEALAFRHTEGTLPRGGGERFGRPGVDFAASPQAALHLPGVVAFEGAKDCALVRCRIEHVGWYAVDIAGGCSGISVVGCDLRDLGAGGVKAGGADAAGPVQRRTRGITLTDNVLSGGGRMFLSAAGIALAHASDNDVSHNLIEDFYYTGISSGWVWGYGENVSKNNRIESNVIRRLGQGLLSDMGGVYLLGVQPGTVVRGNVIFDIEKKNYGGWGIYLDEGCAHVLVENNICFNTSSQGFHQHYGRENIVRNNIFAFCGDGLAAMTRGEAHNSFSFWRNLLVSRGEPMYAIRKGRPKSFLADANLFWNTEGPPVVGADFRYAEARFFMDGELDLAEWRAATGNDLHSVVADPGFVDAERFDFRLRPDSPALLLGFRPIDASAAGPRAERRERD
ncbi:right-handed parallel beta-helix repeat-containing protein [Paenibacillus antri]|uniref:Right-handed parallel beta-helix repeat-containing protein n=1 Tax=Paenibacillus antri TaxID=2582848 RepID=A0A5R9G896_9BACL|nr:right-handed parallel beta-helix repeat-containing protein [Paenibacillus antri]TLS51289.1 right-handed parallel beta-helix repeat-containing protein [Paenibacillus antri]